VSRPRTPHQQPAEPGHALGRLLVGASAQSPAGASAGAGAGSGREQPDDDAVLLALLDGGLSAAEEAAVLAAVDADPALARRLDALIEHGELSGLGAPAGLAGLAGLAVPPGRLPDGSPSLAPGSALGADAAALTAAILAQTVPGAATARDLEATALFAMVAGDGEALPGDASPQTSAARLTDSLLAGLADDDVPLLLGASEAAAVATAAAAARVDLAAMPDRVAAAAGQSERAWALATGAVDGALDAAEVDEFLGLCAAEGNSTGMGESLDGASGHIALSALNDVEAAAPAVAAFAEALRVARDSAAFGRHAARAGDAALAAIATLEANAARGTASAAAASHPAHGRAAVAPPAPSLWQRLGSLLGGLSANSLVPAGAAAAAVAVFLALSGPDAGSGSDGASGDGRVADASTLAARKDEVVRFLIDALTPVALDDNAAAPTAELAVIADNSADVEAIDAASTTLVFATASSNITVIWVSDTDRLAEQGT
jgi:hypothetical protein